LAQERPDLVPSYVPSNPEFDDLPPLLDDETVPTELLTTRILEFINSMP
jgi:hypothetical protein